MNAKSELLSPAGNMEKLRTALRFGADAVYFGGPDFGLRAQAVFDADGVRAAIETAHAAARKAYVTVNVFARNADFAPLADYLAALESYGVDGVIVADLGVLSFCRRRFPALAVHVSTQANTLNAEAARFYAELGVRRIVLARELSLTEIREIRDALPSDVDLEAFVHGAFCISYSGRCLLSNYLTGRESNRGACAQACRWRYAIREVSRADSELTLEEDARGSYILNSKDLNMIEHLRDLIDAGVTAFKIEGRMKTAYYAATVTNAYRRALDAALRGEAAPTDAVRDLTKASNRRFTTGFYYGNENTIDSESAAPTQECDICAVVTEDARDGSFWAVMRNRFWRGLRVEILAPDDLWNRSFVLDEIFDENGAPLHDVKRVGQRVRIVTELPLKAGDILRKDAACVRPES